MTAHNHQAPLPLRFNRQFFADFWRLCKPFWVSEEKNTALMMLALNIVCILVGVWTTIGINHFNKIFYDALGNFDKASILNALGYFTVLLAITILAFGYSSYFTMQIGIRWQRWLTREYQQKWLKENTHYHMQIINKHIDNPDQRISDDLQLLTVYTLSIFFNVFQSLLTLGSFGVILWGLSGRLEIPIGSIHWVIPGYLCWSAFIFAAIGTYLMSKIGRKLSFFNYQQQKFSADFRFSLVRLREASEQIALSRGEAIEKEKLSGLFHRIYTNYLSIIGLQRNLVFFSNGYNNIATIVGILFSMPLYLAKKIQLGGLMQISGAFGAVIGAFSVFINSFYQLTEWRAVIHRLTEFNDAMNALQMKPQKSILIEKNESDDIIIKDLNLTRPDGSPLLGPITLVLKQGDSILLTGSSGIGKSTLLRALAGVWVYGSGTIQLPTCANIVFIPQKPYVPLGTLKEALLYPYLVSVDDALLQEILKKCGLDKFRDDLDTVNHWSHILSLGEQQRLAFGRIFLANPDIICLDESTSALDEESEFLLYENMRRTLPQATIISISHHARLKHFHERIIVLPNERIVQSDIQFQHNTVELVVL